MASLAKVRRAIERRLLGRAEADRRYADRIRNAPDRRVLEEIYLPVFAALGGRILWVGCRPYTSDYPARLEALGGEVWTTDIAPEAVAWGREARHRTGDIRLADALFHDLTFDTILLNGVIGYGVDDPADQRTTFHALSKVLAPGGLLLVGWNVDRVGDPIASGVVAPAFEHQAPSGLPARHRVVDTTHVYDCLALDPIAR